mmetsp:Transcript_19262/g.28049  ORF Transcript_19262/g.28049 Transcript_19262/m.28049 type:complete len:106 (+) Transcript_19262:237-554(+)
MEDYHHSPSWLVSNTIASGYNENNISRETVFYLAALKKHSHSVIKFEVGSCMATTTDTPLLALHSTLVVFIGTANHIYNTKRKKKRERRSNTFYTRKIAAGSSCQ